MKTIKGGHRPRKKVLTATKVMEKKGRNTPKRLLEATIGLRHVKFFSPSGVGEIEWLG